MSVISLSKLHLNVLRLVGTKNFLTVHTFKHCNKLHLRYCISFRDMEKTPYHDTFEKHFLVAGKISVWQYHLLGYLTLGFLN